jgi:hypothetical protein
MNADRRRPERAGPKRRRSQRKFLFDDVGWQGETDERTHRGVLVSVSRHGLAMLITRGHTPPVGMAIHPARRRSHRAWRHAAVVTRIEPVSQALNLVAADFVAGPKRTSTPTVRTTS